MELNGKDDYVARWLHAICAVPLLSFLVLELYLILHGYFFGIWAICRGGLGVGAVWLSYRLLKYAITGNDNINRDETIGPPFG